MKLRLQVISVLLMLAACSKSIHPQQLLTDVKELSSDKYKGRKTGTEGAHLAAAYIEKRFRDLNLKHFGDSYQQKFIFKANGTKEVKAANVVAFIEGKSAEAFVISAHYDHLGVVNGQIYNGADDNASGVAVLLSLAKYFSSHQPQHTLIFAAFDAEEMGLQGSRAFVSKPPLALDRIKLNINLDMVSRADKGEIYACGTYHYPDLKKYIITTNSKLKLMLGHDDPKLGPDDWTSQSDHFAFYQKKIPFIYFGVEDHADYHRPTDDFNRINKETFQDATEIIQEVVRNLDKNISIQSIFREKQRM